MSATILDGRAIAKTMREELRQELSNVAAERGQPPSLAVVQVAGDAASDQYVRSIKRACEQLGATYVGHVLPPDTTQLELETLLDQLSAEQQIHGIIVQLPLPAGISQQQALAHLDPRKDVDGATTHSAGLLAQGLPGLVPNTPAGGMEILRRYGIPLLGKRAVVVGRSTIVGKPMALLLLQEHATVTIAHSRTPNLAEVVREADIVVAAVGRAGLISGDMIKPGATVIDFGINLAKGGAMVGDVDYASAAGVAGAITPVPGGTGPLTNMMLLRNLLQAARELSRAET
jgi:methylenetetrahydrofolate dehydrogenase (NADP+)/methenyltetrahydrofolate cyclohydrolase